MKLSKWFKCCLALFSSILFLSFSSALTLPDRDSLRLRVLEFDRESGKLVQVVTSRHTDIVYGEDVAQGGVIVLECRSSYGPVTFSYKGDGNPEYITNTNTTRIAHTTYYWTFMSFTRIPSAKESGNYTCTTIPDPSMQNSLHLYVPDSSKAVFVPSRLTNRLEYPRGNHFRIPCSVVHPEARVSLERVASDYQRNVGNSNQIAYSPKTGFYIPISMVNSRGSTTFLCKASFRGNVDETEFKIYSEIPETGVEQFFPPQPTTRAPSNHLRSACTKSTCGEFAECIVIDYAAHCVCYEGYSGDPLNNCYKMSEQSQQYIMRDPCSPNPCERNNPCVVVNQHAVCTCQGNHQGTPTVCKSQKTASLISTPTTSSHCRNNNQCEWEEYCNIRLGVCENVCNGTTPFCGVNAQCFLDRSRRLPICTCLQGFTGEAKVKCHKIQPRPQNSAVNSADHLDKTLCNLTKCGIGAKCRLKNGGVQCFCPAGTVGNANVQCSPPVPIEEVDAVKACDNCGPNSVCTLADGKVFCECSIGSSGFPPNCVHKSRSFCKDSFDCSDDKICDKGKCLNPCSWMCSESAICKVSNHVMQCDCPQNTEGDARFGCKKFEEVSQHPCKINCGPNTVCRSVMVDELEKYRSNLRQSRQEALYFDMIKANGNLKQGIYSQCKCQKGHFGNPYSSGGCKPQEAKKDEILEYPETPITIVMEPNPCEPSPCGKNSFCRGYQGKAFCSCDFDSAGQPPRCRRVCKADSHCMFNESCIRGLCQTNSIRSF